MEIPPNMHKDFSALRLGISRFLGIASMLGVLALASSPAYAANIIVNDSSFESFYSSGCTYQFSPPPSWGGSSTFSGGPYCTSDAIDGHVIAFVNAYGAGNAFITNNYIYQDVVANVHVGEEFTLTVWVGGPNNGQSLAPFEIALVENTSGDTAPATSPTEVIASLAESNPGSSGQTVDPAAGTWTQVTLTGTATVTGDVYIILGTDYSATEAASSTAKQVWYDEVTLTATKTPEPASLAIFGTSLLGLGFLYHRKKQRHPIGEA